MKEYIISLDAGTTSIRAFLYDVAERKFVHRAQQEVASSFPHPGWVEQDASEIWFKAAYVLSDCLRAASGGKVMGIGVTNQRETVVCFDAATGEPVAPAIVWQCRRTSAFCASIPEEDAARIKEKCGLLPDAYFSASKIAWILQNVPAARKLKEEGRLRAGTVDSYLIYKLTEGKSFATDCTNASRTMLFNIRTLDWDDDLLAYFGVCRDMLPAVLPCDAVFGMAKLGKGEYPIAGVLGDQQAALFGQACVKEGDVKLTYGTGLFMLFSTGTQPVFSKSGLLTTVGSVYKGRTNYALEGSVFHAGSGVQWLRDELGLIENAAETERLALSVADTGGVFFVPAFTGLGAPYWNSEARGLISGISRGTRREHIVRAVLESIAYSARDLADCMEKDSGIPLTLVRCDGGACANNFLMQFQADVLGIPVDRPEERESTALGAALMCALALGLADEDIGSYRTSERVFAPSLDRTYFDGLYAQYLAAVRRALG